jgi:hypothetical protein
VEFEDLCPACEGSGEISRTKRGGVSVFPTEEGLYRYLVEQEAELEHTIVVEVAGGLSSDRDLDADSGALLVHPSAIVSACRLDPNRRTAGAVARAVVRCGLF